MYEINNKILPKSYHRQKIFNELIHFGYTKPRLLEYKLIRECEIANFGKDRIKNTNISAELKNMLTAFSVMAYFKNINLYFEIVGERSGYFFAEKFEYFVCKLLTDAIKNSTENCFYLKIKLTDKKIYLTLKYKGKLFDNLSQNVFSFTVGENVIINYSEQYIKSKKSTQKPKEVFEWISDRLSDVNISLIDI